MNALALDMALGCSTNTALHLPAIAHEVGVEITFEDVDRMSRRVPQICYLRPAGEYHVEDLDVAGGIPAVMQTLADAGLIDTSCLTVSGKVADRLRKPLSTEVIRPVTNPYKPEGGLAALWGSIAPSGAIVKQGAVAPEMMQHRGPARVFDSEEEAVSAILGGRINPGDVVVIRFEGPKGGPGMREMLSPTSAVVGMGLDKTVALITDGRSPAQPAVRHWSSLQRLQKEGLSPISKKATRSSSASLAASSTWVYRLKNLQRGWQSQ